MTGRRSRIAFIESTKLMQKAGVGDSEAFVCLYDRFAPTLMHLFVRRGADLTLAEDLTQKVFVCLWERRKNFRAESSFETYLFSIAKHALNKEIRESRKVAETGLKGHPKLNEGSQRGLSEPELEIYLKELAAAVQRAKAKLTLEQRQALAVSQSRRISFSTVAQKLGCSQEGLKSHLKRARRRMRELLAPILDDEGGPAKGRPRRGKSRRK